MKLLRINYYLKNGCQGVASFIIEHSYMLDIKKKKKLEEASNKKIEQFKKKLIKDKDVISFQEEYVEVE